MPDGAPQSDAAKRGRPDAANVSELKRGSAEIRFGGGAAVNRLPGRGTQATAIDSSMFCRM